MIEIRNLCKRFGDTVALDNISLDISDEDIFGLIGTNGAGKSTLLRIIAGVLTPDSGHVLVDGGEVFENPGIKQNICFISDSDIAGFNSTPEYLEDVYSTLYPKFNHDRFNFLRIKLGVKSNASIRTFSKGMKRQLMLIIALSTGAKYILCDEAFDGLDPVMRQTVKSIMAEEVYDKKIVPIIASHNLREIEDISGRVGLLHKGHILLSEDLENMKFKTQKFQVVLKEGAHADYISSLLHPVSIEPSGSLLTVIVRGKKEDIKKTVMSLNPVFFEFLPLTLEEIFITETEAAGYDIRKIFA